jgi:hypothetical protein
VLEVSCPPGWVISPNVAPGMTDVTWNEGLVA